MFFCQKKKYMFCMFIMKIIHSFDTCAGMLSKSNKSLCLLIYLIIYIYDYFDLNKQRYIILICVFRFGWYGSNSWLQLGTAIIHAKLKSSKMIQILNRRWWNKDPKIHVLADSLPCNENSLLTKAIYLIPSYN